MADATLVAGLIFAATYAIIAIDRIDRTLAALIGALLMILLKVIDQHEAFAAIDFNVIFLLAGMMILAGILRRTGFFQLVAIRAVKLADGEPIRLMIVLSIVTAVLSAFLDNVTTIVLIAPITLYVATLLRISPLPFLISEILASNIGGAATLIGDPPNILIGSAADLDFAAFLGALGPPALLSLGACLLTVRVMFRHDLEVHADVRASVMALDEEEVVTDPATLRRSLVVIGLTILGFLLHGWLGYEPATVALLGATVLMLIERADVESVLSEVEWKTLLFFVGLFILVEGIVQVGIVRSFADGVIALSGGDPTVTTIGLLWFSGIASGIVDNIPYTATMLPVVKQIGATGMTIEPLWWALALGACLGGNATVIGASANVIAANLAGRAGHPIGFFKFLRHGAVIVVESLLISTGYLWFRYLS